MFSYENNSYQGPEMSSVKIFTILFFLFLQHWKIRNTLLVCGELQGSLLECPRFNGMDLEPYNLSWLLHLSHRVSFVVCVKRKVFVLSFGEREREKQRWL